MYIATLRKHGKHTTQYEGETVKECLEQITEDNSDAGLEDATITIEYVKE
jgi:hypothetical protein